MRWQNRLPAGVGIVATTGSAPPLAKPSSRPSRIVGGVSPESMLSSCRKSRFGARSILSGERSQAGGDGKRWSQQEERIPDLHPVRHATERNGGDARREREGCEEET